MSSDDEEPSNTEQFLAQLGSSFPLCLVILVIFICLRKRFAPQLEVRRSKPDVSVGPISPNTWVYWLYEAWIMSDWDYYRHAGIDALIFDLFLRTVIKICLYSLPLQLLVLVPVFATGEVKNEDELSAISLSNVETESDRLYAVAIMAYAVMGVMQYFFTQLYLKIAYIAREFEIGNEVECIKNLDNVTWRSYMNRSTQDIEDTLARIRAKTGGGAANNKGDGSSAPEARQEAPPLTAMITIDKVEDETATGTGDVTIDTTDAADAADAAAESTDDAGKKLEDDGKTGDIADAEAKDAHKGLISKGTTGSSSSFGGDGLETKKEVVYDRNSEYFEEKSDLFRHSIMISNLPLPFWNDPANPGEKLKMLFDAMYPNQVQNVSIARNVTELVKICNKIDRHEKQLEKVADKPDATTKDKFMGLCGNEVNAKEFHTAKRAELVNQYTQMTTEADALALTPTAFVTLKSFEVAAVCAATPIRFGSTELNISRCHLHRANDVLWENLQFNNFRDQQKYRNSVSLSMVALLLFWSIPAAGIQGLANLRQIFLLADIDLNKFVSSAFWDWLEGFLSVVLLSAWLNIVPVIVTNMVKKEYQTSLGLFSISCMKKYYDCLVFMVLLVTAISGTVLTNISNFSDFDVEEIFTQFGQGLSEMSLYFLMFVMYKALVGLPSTLLRPAYWIVRWLLKVENNEWADNWNSWSNAMLVFAIVLCYCVMAPFIYIVGVVYFTINMVVFRYQSVTCTWQRHEYGSYAMFPSVFNRVMVAVYISLLTLVILLVLKQAVIPVFIVLPLFVFMAIFRIRINSYFEKDFNLTGLNGAKAYDDRTDNSGFEEDAKVYYKASVLRKKYDQDE